MYVLLGAIVFVVPTFTPSVDSGSITKNTMAVLFVVGACYSVMQTVTMMAMADAAAQRLDDLETQLRATVVTADARAEAERLTFSTIELRDVCFRYPAQSAEPGFEIGPLALTLKAGEMVFVTGGNGSGKSTFMKVLAGLYPPCAGEIVLDGAPVDDRSRNAYRSLTAAIFTDGHLFNRLFGIAAPARDEVDTLLRKFGLDKKTAVRDGEFSTLDLSGGQAKRLALLVGLLEKRPLLLLDEWTANQDPFFRGRFYEELLPELTRAGLTIVVVTHDDLYLERFTLPARRLRMDKGRLVEKESTETVR
jgi:putative ATP-binding cassette transporter